MMAVIKLTPPGYSSSPGYSSAGDAGGDGGGCGAGTVMTTVFSITASVTFVGGEGNSSVISSPTPFRDSMSSELSPPVPLVVFVLDG